jgi:hypothetical protein
MKVIEVSQGAYFVSGNWSQTLAISDPSYSNQIVAEPDMTEVEVREELVDSEADELPEGQWG